MEDEEGWRWLTLAPPCGCASRSRQRASSKRQLEDRRFLLPCHRCHEWWHGTCAGVTREHLPRSYLCHAAAMALGADAEADDGCFFVCALCSPTLASELHYRCTGVLCIPHHLHHLQQDGLRVKVLAWGRRPFAEDRLAAEGRFTELFLPALHCCDRPISPPADEWSCLLRCSRCHQWEHCSCALERQTAQRARRPGNSSDRDGDVQWLRRYLSHHIASSLQNTAATTTATSTSTSPSSPSAALMGGHHPLAYFNAHQRRRGRPANSGDLAFLCSACAGRDGLAFSEARDCRVGRHERALKIRIKWPPSPVTNPELYEQLRAGDFSLLDAMNGPRRPAPPVALALALPRLIRDRELRPSGVDARSTALREQAAMALLHRPPLQVAHRVPIHQITGELPWILHHLQSRPMLLVGTSGGSVLSYTADRSQLRLCVDTAHPDIACLAATSASEDRLLSCAWGSGDLLVHDLHTGRPVARGVGHARFCRSLAGDPAQAALVLSASYDATLRLWDLRAAAAAGRRDDGPFAGAGAGAGPGPMAEVMALRGHKGSATAAHFLPGDSHYVLSASADRSIRLWDLRKSGAWVLKVDTGHWLCSLAISPNGHYLAANALPGKVLVFETSRLLSPRGDGVDAPKHVLYGHTNIRWATQRPCFSPDSRVIAIASEDGRVVTWSTGSGELLERRADAHPSGAWAWDVAFDRHRPEGDDALFSCSDDGFLACLRRQRGRRPRGPAEAS